MTIRLTQYLSVIILFFLSQTINAANYYWIGGAGNWGDINHWATTSGGSTLHSFVPTPNDDVFFDGGSGFTAVSKVVTVNTNATCRDMTWSGALNNPQIAGSSAVTLNVSGSLVLQNGMLYNLANVNFVSNNVGETILTNGVVLNTTGFVSFNGTGSWTILDAITATSKRFLFNSGSLNTNNQILDLGQFLSNSSTLRTLSLGTSRITLFLSGITGMPYQWEVSGSNLTLNANLSTIVINSPSYGDFSSSISNLTYGNVIFNMRGNLYCSGSNHVFNSILFLDDGNMGGSSKIGTLTFSSGNIYSIASSSTNTITTQFNASSTACLGWINITSSTPGTPFTLNMPATAVVNVSNCSIQNSNGIGGATFTAINSVNDGNNSGWTFSPPSISDLYWIGGSGNWSDGSHWSISSGGAPSGCIPNPSINAIINAASGLTLANNIITVNTVQNCRNLTCSGSAVPAIINSPAANTGNLNIYGSVLLQSGMTYNVLTDFKSSLTETIQSN